MFEFYYFVGFLSMFMGGGKNMLRIWQAERGTPTWVAQAIKNNLKFTVGSTVGPLQTLLLFDDIIIEAQSRKMLCPLMSKFS